ncbi:glycosyltransferase [Sciscionella marina]|uniref:glycosyltransferase n=1 Tax=Sciscionella marina TaxID=508770 RepID=UPI000365282C|nr:glycosyltransferase [Sciscionella marina]
MPSSAQTPNKAGAGSTKPSARSSKPTTQPRHADAQGTVAARGLFSGPAQVPAELYARVDEGTVHREREQLTVLPETVASTNAYFGRFPASYWQRWTTVKVVTARLDVRGKGTVRLQASDHEGYLRTVAVREVDGADTITLEGKLDKFVDGGSLWIELRTAESELVVEQLRWLVPAPQRLRKTSLIMPTCNRVEDCMTTLTNLAADPVALESLDTVYVADQGSTPVEEQPRFAEVTAALGDHLRYFRQPNLGGAAGYTRGLYEVAESGEEHANVLFMDDDILLDPEIVIRLTEFANHASKPIIVGGQMLNLLHPNQLLASAEYADVPRMIHGLPAAGTKVNQDLLATDEKTGLPKLQERRVDAGYNGWWSCLIPSEVIAEIGYPLPVFFQGDDVELAYRAHEHGFPTVTLPGAGVWHADFHWKDWDEWHRYFNMRNWLIVAALHSEFKGSTIATELGTKLVQYLLGMQYGLAASLLKAVEDFMVGPDILEDGGAAAMAEIRKIRADYPETVKRDPATDELVPSDIPLIPSAPEPKLWGPVTVKRIAYQLLGKVVHPIGEVPAKSNAWWHVALFDTAIVTDMSQEGVRVRKRDRQLALAQAKQGAKLLRELAKRAPELSARYRAAMPRLTSRENWRRLYNL